MLSQRLSLLSSYLRKSAHVSSYPAVIGIETTNNCNLACIMCPRNEMERPITRMGLDRFERIVDDLAGKVEFLWLQGYGEPLLHDDIFTMIAMARQRGIATGLSTNATPLTEEKTRRLIEEGPDYVIVAFDGATAETYEKVRVGADFEKVLRNVERLVAMKDTLGVGPFITLQLICMDETKDEVGRFLRHWRRPGVNGVRIRQLTYSGGGETYGNVTDNRPCYWLWADPHINADGTVIPCCQDVNAKVPLGIAGDATFLSIWNGPAMTDLRRLHREGRRNESPLCAGCNMYQPAPILAAASALFPYLFVNKMVPRVETLLSLRRYPVERETEAHR